MASIDTIGPDGVRLPAGTKAPKGARYRVRYRTPAGKSRTKTFSRQHDAKRFAEKIETAKAAGEFVDPKLGRITVGDWWARWSATQVQWAPATRERYVVNFTNYVAPRIGQVELAKVRRSDLQAILTEAVSGAGLAVSTAKVLRSVLASMFTAAVADGLIAKTPAAALKLPKDDPAQPRPLDDDEIDRLLAACDTWERAWVLMGLGTGVRVSEGLAVRTGSIDFLRRSLEVADQMPSAAWSTANPEGPAFAPLKNRKPREVPLSDALVQVLAHHVELYGTGPEGVLFPNRLGGLWRMKDAVRRFGTIARDAGLEDVTWHCLRDTAATKMLTAGMNPAAVARVLGNTVPVLLTRYAGVLQSDTEIARSALETLVDRTATPGRSAAV